VQVEVKAARAEQVAERAAVLTGVQMEVGAQAKERETAAMGEEAMVQLRVATKVGMETVAEERSAEVKSAVTRAGVNVVVGSWEAVGWVAMQVARLAPEVGLRGLEVKDS
jgi:hypothetical protein